MAYLDDHPPASPQFRCPRRESPSGVIVVHTAESALDLMGPDTGAEAVAAFIARRTDPGSYHELIDSDSFVSVVRWECEAYHDGTGSNRHSMGLSFALRAADWPTMTQDRIDRFLARGAARAAAYAKWVQRLTGVVVPARRLTRAESELRKPGFISHAERDPARRTDPGAGFPWTRFLALYANLMEDDDVALTPAEKEALAQIPAMAEELERVSKRVGTDNSGADLSDEVDMLRKDMRLVLAHFGIPGGSS